MSSRKIAKLLNHLWYGKYKGGKLKSNKITQGLYARVAILHKEAKKYIPTITQKQVQNFLQNQTAYQLAKQSKRGKTRPVIAFGLYRTVAIDTAFFGDPKSNYQVKGTLIAVDVFSDYVHFKFLKNRTAKECANKIEEIICEILERGAAVPETITCDQAAEFLSEEFTNVLEKWGINMVPLASYQKNSPVERMIGTLRSKLGKYYATTGYKHKRFYFVFKKIVEAVNRTERSYLNGRSPAELTIDEDREIFLKRFKPKLLKGSIRNIPKHKLKKPKFSVGDKVRVRIHKTFAKSSDQRFSSNIYYVSKVKKNFLPYCYKISKEKGGESFRNVYYASDLIKAN